MLFEGSSQTCNVADKKRLSSTGMEGFYLEPSVTYIIKPLHQQS